MPLQSGTGTELAISRRYGLARMLTIALVLSFASLFTLLPLLFGGSLVENLTLRLGSTQDMPLVWIFLLTAFLQPTPANSVAVDHRSPATAALFVSVLFILLAGAVGNHVVFHGYAVTRDEQMAIFDQQIFVHGRLLWPIPTDWRFVADALNRRFMLPIGANEFWVSGYLPVHSAFRALLASIGISDLSSPLMAALSAVALWTIARKLWPDSKDTAVLALLLLVTSSQVIITAMTAFSMSMHLALNLVWLALFLADRRQTHAVAALVGFFATGIHQPLFHPLFVLPFFLLLAEQRRCRLLGFYLASYALIGAFWMAWPLWITSHGTSPPTAIHCASTICSSAPGFIDRLRSALTTFDVQHIWMTAANVLRFVCWQHPLLVPLALFGAMTCWRSEPLVRALAIGFVLPVVVMAVILPWQGHGWGYRYVHQVLGNAILLACYGFRRLETNGLSMRRPLIVSSAMALVLLPLHGWMAERVAAPFVRIHDELASIPADVVIVDTEVVPYGQDVVGNRFDLSNRPKLLIAALVKPADLLALCKRSTIVFYDSRRMAPIAQLFGMPPPKGASPQVRRLRELAKNAGCTMAPGTARSREAA